MHESYDMPPAALALQIIRSQRLDDCLALWSQPQTDTHTQRLQPVGEETTTNDHLN